ncbi:MAG TPA: HD domain-containing protein [Candidatus Limnocylindrales bacterium]
MAAIDPLARPSTPTEARAREVLERFATPALVNHSLRSAVWAAAYAAEHGIAHDAELLYVAAMLHDIGLTPSFDAHAVPFETAGGHVGWVLAAGAGWPVARRDRVVEVIERHMWDSVDPALDAEGYLLEIATALDISGRNPDWWPAALRRSVLAALPRLDLVPEFTACFEAEAARKPTSSAAAAMASGIAGRLADNVLNAEQATASGRHEDAP